MANTYTPGKANLVEPPYQSYTDQWDKPVNSNFAVINATVAGTTKINAANLTPGVPEVVLTFQTFEQNPSPETNPLAGQNLRILVYGALQFDVSIKITNNYPGLWIIDNQTTGNYAVNVLTTAAGSVGIKPTQGFMTTVFCDGIDVSYADLGTARSFVANHVVTGTIVVYGSTTIPAAGYLKCDGSAVNRTAYADLFSAIGTGWGSGDGLTTFNVPNLTFGTSPGTYMIKT